MKVSACIITYNHEPFIEECLLGALGQQVNFDYEIVIGEDKSTDGTLAICRKYAAMYPDKIRLIERNVNLGMVGNWHDTLKNCQGEYIAICEGDDYWNDPLKLQKQFDFMERHKNMVFCFHGATVLQDSTILGDYYKHKSFIDKQKVPLKYFIANGGGGFATASAFFRSEILKDLPDYFLQSHLGDMPLALLAISKGDIGYLQDKMAVYRYESITSWSKSTSAEGKIKGNLKALQTIQMFDEFTNFKFHKDLCLLYQNNFYNRLVYEHLSQPQGKAKLLLRLVANFSKIGLINFLKSHKYLR